MIITIECKSLCVPRRAKDLQEHVSEYKGVPYIKEEKL